MVACLSALFTPDPTKHTQYRGVYPRKDRPNLYAAKFKLGQRLLHLGYFPNPREAAERVAAEYAAWYGPLWWKRFASLDERRRNPWEVVPWAGEPARPKPRPKPVIGDDGYHWPPRPRPTRERYGAVPVEGGGPTAGTPTGYAVTVWEWGRPAVLGDHLHPSRPALDWPHRRRPWVWPTPAAALAGFRRWRAREMARRWGLWSAMSLWR